VPNIYHKAFAAVDPINSGDTSVNLLSRVLGTSSLPAATIDKVKISSPIFIIASFDFDFVVDRESCQ
jgi:hypothetical protein